MKKFYTSHLNEILLAVSLILSLPLLLKNAIEYSYPLGYAGLFTQMAEQIAENNFRLPLETPFYGPGGIPFAYPPLGLYLLAILIKLTGKYFIFLRFIPPLISFASLIPLFYLTLELSKSSIAALITVILTATSQDLYIANAWAAGIARAPAFFCMLVSLYYFSRQRNNPARLNLVFMGIFLGLSVMSHLVYALFCVFWVGWWALFSGEVSFKKRLQNVFLPFAVSALIASIWLVPTLSRHGMLIFLDAFNSHGAKEALSFWQNIQGIPGLFLLHTESVTSNGMLFALILSGMIFLIFKRKFTLVAFFLFIVMVFPERERFVFLLGCIIAGIGVSMLLDLCFVISKERMKQQYLLMLIIPIIGMIWWSGLESISKYSPLIDRRALDLAQYIQLNMKPKQTYLALVKQDEAEWFPFLFQREPLVAQWGSEWLGAYNEQTYMMARFRDCRAGQDWTCIEGVFPETGKYPDIMVTYAKDNDLNEQVASSGSWFQLYINNRYIVWSFIE